MPEQPAKAARAAGLFLAGAAGFYILAAGLPALAEERLYVEEDFKHGKFSPPVVSLTNQIDKALKEKKQYKINPLLNQYQRTNPCTEEFFQAIAEVYHNNNMAPAEHDIVTAGLKKFPHSVPLLYRNSQYWLKVNELDLAEPPLKLCLQLAPKNALVHSQMARYYNERLNFSAALKEVDTALAIGPADAFMYLNKANSLRNLNRTAQAIAVLDQAVKVAGGRDLDIRKLRTQLNYQAGNYQKAIDDSLHLAKVDPSHAPGFNARVGDCYMGMKKPKEALKYYDIAIRYDGENSLYHRGKLSALEAMHATEAALAEKKLLNKLELDYSPNK